MSNAFTQRRAQLQAATDDFITLRSSHQSQMLLALLNALIAQYHADLAVVKPERLGYVQGALAQVMALRQLICEGNANLSPLA
jgi:hypothetical protein